MEAEKSEFINSHYGDRYFSTAGGLAEALHVFVQGNGMVERFAGQGQLVVGELGFGTGLNLLASLHALAAGGQCGSLTWFSVEKYPLSVGEIRAALDGFPELAAILANYLAAYPVGTIVGPGWNYFNFHWHNIQVFVQVYFGDVLEMLATLAVQLPRQGLDCWVLDGHSPALNPEMWSDAVFQGMAGCSRVEPASSFASYTAAGLVKQGLRRAGFLVRRQPGHGAKRHMISGAFAPVAPERNA